jgi:hypothetical protein
MDLELWSELSAAISDVEQRWPGNARDRHPTSRIVRVHLWATLHDRPTCWACAARHWTEQTRPKSLPDQSTMSRRMKRADFDAFLARVGERLNGRNARDKLNDARQLKLRMVDGKPLELPNHSTDPDARWGRGVSRSSIGYKLHWLCSIRENPMPDEFVITPLNRCEKRMAARMIKRVHATDGSAGYLLGDALFNASWLFDHCRAHGHQLVCPRQKPNRSLGNHYQAPDRLRAVDMLESPMNLNSFGTALYSKRTTIERRFSAAVCFGGGIGSSLPPWVRRIGRVRRWITAKILINAARIRLKRKVHA